MGQRQGWVRMIRGKKGLRGKEDRKGYGEQRQGRHIGSRGRQGWVMGGRGRVAGSRDRGGLWDSRGKKELQGTEAENG